MPIQKAKKLLEDSKNRRAVIIVNITPKSPRGGYLITTASGTVYQLTLTDSKALLRRTSSTRGELKSSSRTMHRDEEELTLHDFKAEIGAKAVFLLERQPEGITVRQTTEVVQITQV
jgi:hypothetical protein